MGPYCLWLSSKSDTWSTPLSSSSCQFSPSQLSASPWLAKMASCRPAPLTTAPTAFSYRQVQGIAPCLLLAHASCEVSSIFPGGMIPPVTPLVMGGGYAPHTPRGGTAQKTHRPTLWLGLRPGGSCRRASHRPRRPTLWLGSRPVVAVAGRRMDRDAPHCGLGYGRWWLSPGVAWTATPHTVAWVTAGGGCRRAGGKAGGCGRKVARGTGRAAINRLVRLSPPKSVQAVKSGGLLSWLGAEQDRPDRFTAASYRGPAPDVTQCVDHLQAAAGLLDRAGGLEDRGRVRRVEYGADHFAGAAEEAQPQVLGCLLAGQFAGRGRVGDRVRHELADDRLGVLGEECQAPVAQGVPGEPPGGAGRLRAAGQRAHDRGRRIPPVRGHPHHPRPPGSRRHPR